MVEINDDKILETDIDENLEQLKDLKAEDQVKVTETGELAVVKSIDNDGMTDNKIIHVEFLEGDRAGTLGEIPADELELAA